MTQAETIAAWAAFGITIEVQGDGSWLWAEACNGLFSPSFSTFERCTADLEDCLGDLASQ